VGLDGSLAKAERQKLVLSLIGRMQLGTQQELLEALAAAGCKVTQATVSRDVGELGLQKQTDPLGRKATAAQNLVVVHCEIGSAPAIARALDQIGHPRVVGTLAGDDTLLVVAADAEAARKLADELG